MPKKKEKKEQGKICIKCDEKILKGQKYVRITTYFEDLNSADEFYHWKCWKDNFSDAVKNKVKQGFEQVKDNFQKVVKDSQDLIKKELDYANQLS